MEFNSFAVYSLQVSFILCCNLLYHRMYGLYTLEVILASAFGRNKDIQNSADDRLVQAAIGTFEAVGQSTPDGPLTKWLCKYCLVIVHIFGYPLGYTYIHICVYYSILYVIMHGMYVSILFSRLLGMARVCKLSMI